MRHMNRCNVPHFVMMKATISQERESAVGPATGNLTQGDLRNDCYANHGGYQQGGGRGYQISRTFRGLVLQGQRGNFGTNCLFSRCAIRCSRCSTRRPLQEPAAADPP